MMSRASRARRKALGVRIPQLGGRLVALHRHQRLQLRHDVQNEPARPPSPSFDHIIVAA